MQEFEHGIDCCEFMDSLRLQTMGDRFEGLVAFPNLDSDSNSIFYST